MLVLRKIRRATVLAIKWLPFLVFCLLLLAIAYLMFSGRYTIEM